MADQGQSPEQPAANGVQAISNGSSTASCPPNVLQAIYGTSENKKTAYEASLKRWWAEYADRKNDETDEYVANSLLYDRNHLPRSAPAPDCVLAELQQSQQEGTNQQT